MLKNMKLIVKLWLMVIPAIITLLALLITSVITIKSTNNSSRTILYDELFVSTALILNADRDFYQANLAEKNYILMPKTSSAEAKDNLLADYHDNAQQTLDRITEAINNVKSNHELFATFQHSSENITLEELEKGFFKDYQQWLDSYDPATNTGDLTSHDAYFEKTREYMNLMTEILEDYADESSMQRNEDIMKLNYLIVVIVVIMVILVGIIAFSLAKSLRSSINALNSNMTELSGKNLCIELNQKELEAKDEFGSLSRSFSTVLDALKEIVSKLNTGVSTLKASTSTLNEDVTEISKSMAEITDSVSQVAQGATQQASDTTSVAKDMHDLGNIIDENSRNAKDLFDASNQIQVISSEGLEVVNNLSDITVKNQVSFSHIFDVIQSTSESASRIGDASKLISDIADQTNLLALNAAIEAARAGEAGKGFAVVAEEIRQLAEQSTSSTKIIDSMLDDLKTKVENANQQSENIQSAVADQFESVQLTKEKYVTIADTIQSINDKITVLDNVSLAMSDKRSNMMDMVESLSAIAEENAASTQETSASITQISSTMESFRDISNQVNSLALDLLTLVEDFNL